MKAEFLEPCPFCGSDMRSFAGMTPDAFAKSQDGFTKAHNGYAVNCECGAIGPIAPTMEQAVEGWNARRTGQN